jgi:hypothetical protein
LVKWWAVNDDWKMLKYIKIEVAIWLSQFFFVPLQHEKDIMFACINKKIIMKQEDKELLLKDLCARLQYGVKVYNTTFKEPTIQTLYGKISSDVFLMEETYTSFGVDEFGSFNKRHYTRCVDFIKPFLRPMSSMTEEEAMEYANCGNIIANSPQNNYLIPNPNCVDWLNVHHFDYRGLIEKGLALKALEGMYNIKEK